MIMPKKFKKVYIEIGNICNLQCRFCPGTRREPRQMSAKEFAQIVEQIKDYTEHIYLHLMGEPLLHPELAEILKIARKAELSVNVVTNGTLLESTGNALIDGKIRRCAISLHCAECSENYLNSVFDFAEKASRNGIITVLRLWVEGRDSEKYHAVISRFGEGTKTRNGLKFAEKLYLEFGEEFDWPDENAPERKVGFCYGLRDQIGVLADGTVVPCCLDCDGTIALGNLFDRDLDFILSSPRAQAIIDGFSRRKPSEELCKHCGYAERF